jgi:hypothetical protein
MCTLTIIETPKGGYRVVHARDEQRDRSEAVGPTARTLRSGLVVECPTDPDAGGTWVATTKDGVCTGVLNVNIPDNGRAPATKSRGEIPLAIIDAPDLESRLKVLEGMDLTAYAPHTAFAVEMTEDGLRVLITRWDGLELRVLRDPSEFFTPVVVASSGLGDEIVQDRLPLFEEMVRHEPTPANQDEYHHHRWEDRPEESVLMSREDARTVSITTVEFERGSDGPTMRYEALEEGDPSVDPVGAGLLQ